MRLKINDKMKLNKVLHNIRNYIQEDIFRISMKGKIYMKQQ